MLPGCNQNFCRISQAVNAKPCAKEKKKELNIIGMGRRAIRRNIARARAHNYQPLYQYCIQGAAGIKKQRGSVLIPNAAVSTISGVYQVG